MGLFVYLGGLVILLCLVGFNWPLYVSLLVCWFVLHCVCIGVVGLLFYNLLGC